MDSEIFLNWFTHHFLVDSSLSRPILFLLDGHSTHYNPSFVRRAAKEKVMVFCLPPNTIHLTQPLDKGILWRHTGTRNVRVLCPRILVDTWQSMTLCHYLVRHSTALWLYQTLRLLSTQQVSIHLTVMPLRWLTVHLILIILSPWLKEQDWRLSLYIAPLVNFLLPGARL